MIRKLRAKFVTINMTVITVMLCAILGMVMHFTAQNMETESVNMMRRIANAPFQLGRPGENRGEVRLPYFTVFVGQGGEILSTEGGYYDLSDQALVRQMVDMALDSTFDTGVLYEYGLRFLRMGDRIVFADMTNELNTLWDLFLTCLLIGITGLGAFLFISMMLARWAVKPVDRALEQQRQFVADASHELKTPLSVIMANAELLQSQDSISKQENFAERILSVSYQMRTLVENLLDMARVDNGAATVFMEDLDMSQLVSDAALSFQLLYEDQLLGLDAFVEDDVWTKGSPQHLYQVMDVLLDNALKYSTPQSTVTVRLKTEGKWCRISVFSPGTPLPAQERKNIFKRFYRLDKARSTDGSYGLGLPIAESIVTAHKGKIWVEPREDGNEFFVRLPVLKYIAE